MKHILVVGSINADMVIYTETMPNMGETIHGHDFAVNAGGKGANQAVSAARLGAEVKMVGSVGSDANSRMLLDNFLQNGVGTEGVAVLPGSCGVAVITVCQGDNCIILDGGANQKTAPKQLEGCLSLFDWADFVVLQLEIPMDTVVCAAKLARQRRKTVVLNPAPIAPIPSELLACTDLFVPNRSEAEGFLGHAIKTMPDAMRAAEEIRLRGVPQVIITLGGEGCVYTDGGAVYHHPAQKALVADTTAAGDSFIAGVVTKLAEGKTMGEAVEFATRVSAITVSRAGAQSSLPFLQEIGG